MLSTMVPVLLIKVTPVVALVAPMMTELPEAESTGVLMLRVPAPPPRR